MIHKDKIIQSIKMSFAAIVAITLANSLHLEYAVSAGVVAILSIAATKQETIQTAIHRFMMFLLALVIAYLCYTLIGYTLEAFFVYLVLFIFICQGLNYPHTITLTTVLISHFLTTGKMDVASVGNEVLLFIIGVTLGMLVNLHLRKNVLYIEQLKQDSDTQIKQVLYHMSLRVLNEGKDELNEDCFTNLNNSIHRAKSLAIENNMNQLFKDDSADQEYIMMRATQVHVLYNMYQRVQRLEVQTMNAIEIASLLEKMANTYHRDNCSNELIEDFMNLNERFKETPLPIHRKEFETRAQLYILMRDIEEFIMIKNKFCLKKIK